MDERQFLLPPSQQCSLLPQRSRSLSRRPHLYLVPLSQSIKLPLADLQSRSQDNLLVHSAKFQENFDKYMQLLSQKPQRWAYVAYYLPILQWLPLYRWSDQFLGDLVAGLSSASFQIPLVMSFARLLAHLPAILGLLSIIVGPLVYAVFGTVPILMVGPLPLSAIMYGQVVESYQFDDVAASEKPKYSQLEVLSALTAVLSVLLLLCGLCRLGYLDKVFSRALLKGFIGAMGVIMIVNQLPIELGLEPYMSEHPQHLIFAKMHFIWDYAGKAHKLTCLILVVTLLLVLLVKRVKSRIDLSQGSPLLKKAVTVFPELLIMVVVLTLLSWRFNWHGKGVSVIGKISLDLVQFQNIFAPLKKDLYLKVFTTSVLVTILGFFDLTTATRTLESKYDLHVLLNRELIALGAVNLATSLVAGLPSFGAFGRSKISKAAGALSPMAGVIMLCLTLTVAMFVLEFLFWLPECVLALTTTVIGITVLEEMPHDLKFYWNTGGYDELATFAAVFFVTLGWLAQAGVFLGVAIAVIRVIKIGTTLRIQILGRIPNTPAFRNADELIEERFEGLGDADGINDLAAELELIEGTLIVKIPEPLTFANATDLRSKYARLHKYRLLLVHPSQPQGAQTPRKVVIDCKGMTAVDTAGVQALKELVESTMVRDGLKLVFTRVPLGPVRKKLESSGIVALINESMGTISGVEMSSGLGPGFYMLIEDGLHALTGDIASTPVGNDVNTA